MSTKGKHYRLWLSVITPESRFWLHVWPRGDCWEWRGHRTFFGYGMFHQVDGPVDGREHEYSHRHAYELAKGTIPFGYEVDHLCCHAWCVKPSHLEAVPPRVNMLRSNSLGAINARKTHCKRGHPLSGDNLYRYKDGRRACRACWNVPRHAA